MTIDPVAAYLIGLLLGRGHIYRNQLRLIIEFAHKNKNVEGISTCAICSGLVTKNKANNNALVCKDCNAFASVNNAKIYEQVLSTQNCLKETIIPFLQSRFIANYSILGNSTITFLTIDLKKKEDFDLIVSLFGTGRNFSEFHMPIVANDFEYDAKIELINGLLDTAGFPSTGGWLNRDGVNGHGRMRAYFQIVRNWHLVVELDNFLRQNFELPIQTIDWGHPNIRDGNLKDYFDSSPVSWSREHQLKFFPEYFGIFHFRLPHKQLLFLEFIQHNNKAGFKDKSDWFPPSVITEKRLKPYHPGENDQRMPEVVRTHFDAFWQINYVLGCKYIRNYSIRAKDIEAFAITGNLNSTNYKLAEESNTKIRIKETEEVYKKHSSPKIKLTKAKSKKSALTEIDLYEPLVNWLKIYIQNIYNEDAEVFDVSVNNISLVVQRSEQALAAFEYCHNYHISPDVVGFLAKSNSLVFIEAKITALNLANVGQLLGYCFVARPQEAILVSTLEPSASLIRSIQANPHILDYGPGRIKLAVWANNSMNFIEI